jgi:hypothetical protein
MLEATLFPMPNLHKSLSVFDSSMFRRLDY